MDEYFWLSLCFFTFIAVAGRSVWKMLNNFLVSKQKIISDQIREAERVFEESREKLNEANAMHAQLTETISFIEKEAQKSLEFEIEKRKEHLNRELKLKKTQLENMITKEMSRMKKDMLEILLKDMEAKLAAYFADNKTVSDRYLSRLF